MFLEIFSRSFKIGLVYRLETFFFFFYKYFYYVFLLCLSVDWTTILPSVMYLMSIFAALFSVVVIQIVLYV